MIFASRYRALLGLVGLALSAPAAAQQVLIDRVIQGGISVDTSGVSTPITSTGSWHAANPLNVQIPDGARIVDVLAVVQGHSGGLPINFGYVDKVRLNGVPIDQATLVSAFAARTHVYRLDPLVFDITGPGTVTYEETDSVELVLNGGTGVAGTTLAVLYEHDTLPGKRHVVFGVHNTSNGSVTVPGVPAYTDGRVVLAIGESWETSFEQNTRVTHNGSTVTTVAGGRDDGTLFSSNPQDWNSLITGGSFGYTNDDEPIGTDGDALDAEPVGGTTSNSRLSDELWRLDYDNRGSAALTFFQAAGNGFFQFFALAYELDSDGDGVIDALDACEGDDAAGDTDGDGVCDDLDPCPFNAPDDAVGDGLCDDATCSTDWSRVAFEWFEEGVSAAALANLSAPNHGYASFPTTYLGSEVIGPNLLPETYEWIYRAVGVDAALPSCVDEVDVSVRWRVQKLTGAAHQQELLIAPLVGTTWGPAATDARNLAAGDLVTLEATHRVAATDLADFRFALGVQPDDATVPQQLRYRSINVQVTAMALQGSCDVSDLDGDGVCEADDPCPGDALDLCLTPPGDPTVDALFTNDSSPTLTGTFDNIDYASLVVTVGGVTYTTDAGEVVVDLATGRWSLPLPVSLPDGTYDVVVVQTDPDGDTSTDQSTDELVIDATPPAVPTVDDLFTSDPNPTLTGTFDGDDVAGLTVTVDGTTYTLGDDPALTVDGDTWSLDLVDADPLADDTYTVQVVVTDAAGNASIGEGTLVVDTTIPGVPTVTPLLTNDRGPTVTGTYDASTFASLTVTVNGVTYTSGTSPELQVAGGTWTLDLAGRNLADGAYDVAVTQANQVGTTSQDATVDELTVDATPPGTPTVTSQLTNDPEVVLTGSYDPNDFDALTVTVAGSTYTAGQDAALVLNTLTGTWTLTLPTPLAEGTYDVAVTQTDAAGNSSADATVDELVIDLTPPIAPTVTDLSTPLTNPVLQGTYDPTDTVALTVTVNGETYTLGEDVALTVDDDTGTWTLDLGDAEPLADGSYPVVVVATDDAGNPSQGQGEIFVDSTLPLAPTVDRLTTNSASPTLTGTYDADKLDQLSVTVDGVTYVADVDAALTLDDGVWSLDLSGAPLADGTYDVAVSFVNQVGVEILDTTVNEVIIDTTPPNAPTVDQQVSADGRPVITGGYDPSDYATLTVTVHGLTFTTELSPELTVNAATGTWQLDLTGLPQALPESVFDVAVTQTDRAGNEAFDATVGELVVEYPVPGRPTVDSVVSTDGLPVLTGTYDQALTDDLWVTVNGVTYTTTDARLVLDPDAGTWQLDLTGLTTPLADGTYDVTAEVFTPLGTTERDATTDELLVDATAPGVPTVGAQLVATGTPTLSGTYDPSDFAELTITVGDQTFSSADGSVVLDPDAGTWTLDVPVSLLDGTYDVVVVQVDPAGNTSTDTTADELRVDTTPPGTPTVDLLVSADGLPILTGTYDANDDGVLVVTVDGVSYTSGEDPELLLDPSTGTWELDLTGLDTPLAEGVYDVAVLHVDEAGNSAPDETIDELEVGLPVDTADTADTGALPPVARAYYAGGCAGCATGAPPSAWWGLLGLLALRRRRDS